MPRDGGHASPNPFLAALAIVALVVYGIAALFELTYRFGRWIGRRI